MKTSVTEGLNRLQAPPAARFVELMRHGSMSVELYAPRGIDPQQPHRRDELYFVVAGTAEFVREPIGRPVARQPVASGDALFVPAGEVHRFECISTDFATWVVFWGPDGGEKQ